jgi:penicillin-binding protein 1A
MNLKEQKNKKTFDLKSILNFASAKAFIKKGRKTSSLRRPVGDFGSRLNDKKQKNKNLSKTQIYLQRAGIFFTLAFLFVSLIGILVLLGVVSAMSRDLPDVDKYLEESKRLGTETIIYDRSGVELYRLRGKVVNERVSLKDVPDKQQWAFLAAEDANFKTHKGLDLFGLSRAVSCAVGNYLQGQSYETCGGGSSITQQLIKVTSVQSTSKGDERTLDRKIREAILAMRVEETYSKEEILESYLNVVGQGREYVGVKTGSIYIFGKSDMNQLTLAEMCYIAAFPNNPEIFSPRGAIYNPERSQERALYVLERMYELRDRTGVTKEEYEAAKTEIPNVKFANDQINIKAGHFVNETLNEIDKLYADKVGEGERGRDYLRSQGYKVYTSLDYTTQELLEKTVKERVESAEFQNKTGAQTASSVIMDVKTGEILAMVGSKDFNGAEGDIRFSPKFNAATAFRPVGSSAKPFIYGATFEKGYNPSSVVVDIPIDQSPTAAVKPGAPYPYNFNRQFSLYGANRGSTTGRGDFITQRQALKYSLNQPAVTAVNIVGIEQIADFYVRATGNESLRSLFQGPASALGAANVPLLEHVHAYTTIADNGNYKPMKYILKIEDEKGGKIYENAEIQSKQVIEKSVAYLINDMNKYYYIFDQDVDPRVGPNSRALITEVRKNTDFAGKTGTSDTADGKAIGDIVFVGYTPDVVIGMWAGNSCGSQDPACPKMKSTSESSWLYEYIFAPFFDAYKGNLKPGRFQRPEGVRTVAVCSLTGNAYSEDCAKAGGTAIQEMVSSISMPKPETWIENQSVTDCGGTLKLARDSDRQLGLATNRYTVRYDKIFPQKYISDQVIKYLSARPAEDRLFPIVTETCNIERSLAAPQITISTPIQGAIYSQSETINFNGIIKSDLPIQKVDLVYNNTIIGTVGAGNNPQFNVDGKTLSTGQQRFRMVATNSQGAEGSAEVVVNIVSSGGNLFFNQPTPQGQQLQVGSTMQVYARVVGGLSGPINFRVVDASNGVQIGNPMTVTQANTNTWNGSWVIPNSIDTSKTYKVIATAGGVSAEVPNVRFK